MESPLKTGRTSYKNIFTSDAKQQEPAVAVDHNMATPSAVAAEQLPIASPASPDSQAWWLADSFAGGPGPARSNLSDSLLHPPYSTHQAGAGNKVLGMILERAQLGKSCGRYVDVDRLWTVGKWVGELALQNGSRCLGVDIVVVD